MLVEQPVSQHIIGRAISLPNGDLYVGWATNLPTHWLSKESPKKWYVGWATSLPTHNWSSN